jgi:hypothetical protein
MTVTVDSTHAPEHEKFMKKIDATLKKHNEENIVEIIENVNELIDALSTLREDEKADFSHHDDLRQTIDRVFEANPRAFAYEKTYNWDTQKERDELISALKEQFQGARKTSLKKEPIPLEQLLMAAPEPEEVEPPPPETEPENPQEETKKWVFKDVNLGYAFIKMNVQAFDITEARIHKLVRQLSHLNEVNKDLSDFINALTRCKESGKADFSKDDEMQVVIDRIFEVNPKIFGGQKMYAWQSEKQIDVLLSAVDGEIKTKIAEINQVTMFINVRFDERVQYSENSRKVLDMLIRHCESIISKYHKT